MDAHHSSLPSKARTWPLFSFYSSIGAPVNAVNNQGNSPLHVMTRLNCIPMISCLLAAGAMVDKPSKDGITSLRTCALYEQIEVLQLLLKTRDNKPNPAASDNEPIVHPLFVESSTWRLIDASGKMPLHLAVQADLKESVRKLLQNGASIKPKHHQWSELPYAVSLGRTWIIGLILDHQAKTDPC